MEIDDQTALVLLAIVGYYANDTNPNPEDISRAFRYSDWVYPRLKAEFEKQGMIPEMMVFPDVPFLKAGSKYSPEEWSVDDDSDDQEMDDAEDDYWNQ